MRFPGLIRVSLCLLLIWATPVLAASDGLRPFARLSGIYVLPEDSDIEYNGSLLKGNGTVETDAALGVMGAIGMQWPSGFQLEIEVGYRSIDLKTIDGTATVGGTPQSGERPVEGEIKTVTIMPNIRYVLPRSLGGLHPYIGCGMGVALHDGKISNADLGSAEGSDGAIAYQAMLGISYDFTDSLKGETGYRFLGSAEFKDGPTTFDYNTHGLDFGLAYHF